LPFDEARAVTGSPKLDVLLDHLEQAVAEGHKSLVFSQWPLLLQRAADRCSWPYLYLDGSTKNRQALVEKFQDPDGPSVFFISLKAGGTGLTLTEADHVFHLDPWWNPMVEDQATDRAHRIGQTRPVVAYRIVARDTVEEKILELQDRKRALFEAAVERDRIVVDALSQSDLDGIFSL
jgi:SNF2 family DNA or RNA helicase